jgi:hypothetical protein
MCLALMPVCERIHSSLVSSFRANSSLSMRRDGTALPVPFISKAMPTSQRLFPKHLFGFFITVF